MRCEEKLSVLEIVKINIVLEIVINKSSLADRGEGTSDFNIFWEFYRKNNFSF